MLVLNDIHIGVQRKAGTTPKSQEALRDYLFKSFEDVLHDSIEDHLVILGDLFDEFEVPPRDWVQTYLILQDWLVSRPRLTLVAGNHDHSPKALRVSSFEMLARVLLEQFGPDKVTVIGIDEWKLLNDGTVALAHCSNQDIFDLKMNEILAIAKPEMYVMLHANFDNNFAAQSDHSLNVSGEFAQKFASKGATLVFAHEHQARTAYSGSVVVLGNQWPTSISDCLNNDEKFAHVFKGSVDKIPTWGCDLENGFSVVDWRELSDCTATGFVRVEGSASSNEASDVINAIAAFRMRSDAFVITNATKIDGIVAAEALPASFEVAKKFDVMAFIKKNLDEAECAVVDQLLGVQS